AGSRLRSNETRSWTLELPTPRVQIDIDPAAASRNYLMDNTLVADCRALLAALAERVQGRMWGDARWDSQLKAAVEAAEQGLRDQCGAYAKLNDAIAQALPDDGILVRDITVSGSLWGSRLFRAHGPLMNIHSLAGAIGMGLPMAVGTAIANPQRKVVGLVGDGGLSLNLGELATLAQEKANVTLLIMNDGGYGVMRGIQDKYFGGRQYYNELHTPDFTLLAQAMGLQAWSVDRAEDFQAVMTEALAMP
ncbi:thiamine pyrophosphate-dependent enzyme, partial [Klebsiella pneumoniae]|nr:thiamine pyrophosphate-dependent enzyme [Klebsiella pneumoniae]